MPVGDQLRDKLTDGFNVDHSTGGKYLRPFSAIQQVRAPLIPWDSNPVWPQSADPTGGHIDYDV